MFTHIPMKFKFKCVCGEKISDHTRGSELNFQVPCDECDAKYAVTVTQIYESE